MRASSSALMRSPCKFSLIDLCHRAPAQITITAQILQRFTEGWLDYVGSRKIQCLLVG